MWSGFYIAHFNIFEIYKVVKKNPMQPTIWMRVSNSNLASI
jgi:hypothetical protein